MGATDVELKEFQSSKLQNIRRVCVLIDGIIRATVVLARVPTPLMAQNVSWLLAVHWPPRTQGCQVTGVP